MYYKLPTWCLTSLRNHIAAYGPAGSLERAEELAESLRAAFPHERFKAERHGHLSFGVVRYIPYCEQMPFRNTGFIDFLEPEYNRFLTQFRPSDETASHV